MMTPAMKDLASMMALCVRPIRPSSAIPVLSRLEATADWILTAVKGSCGKGISAGYDLLRHRWKPSYPEITGYAVPTLFACARRLQRADLRDTAISLAEYLLETRTPEGGVGHWKPTNGARSSPIVFDTGQVLFGWLAAWRETGNDSYRKAAVEAADWLVAVQSQNGAWQRFQHLDTVKVIDTRVAWALLEAAGVTGNPSHLSAAKRNLDWALDQQQSDGWFHHAAFRSDQDPFTHTIAYTAEGLQEAGLLLGEQKYVDAAERVVLALLDLRRSDGSLAGTYGPKWRPTSRSSCLTGDCQVALLWLRFYGLRKNPLFLEAARETISFVSATQHLNSRNPGVKGGIAGSWPIYGAYERFQFPGWAAKFYLDALMGLEAAESGTSLQRHAG